MTIKNYNKVLKLAVLPDQPLAEYLRRELTER